MTLTLNHVPGVQGSQEWLQARVGRVTASRIADVMDQTKKGEPGAKNRTYLKQIVAELVTGIPCDDTYITQAMRWGTEQEPHARVAYELARGVVVREVGLLLHPAIEGAAASPDGIVSHEGLLEIKCPETATHIWWLANPEVPERHFLQVQWQMAVTGAAWCDYVSFDPRVPDEYQLGIMTVQRDQPKIDEIEAKVKEFLAEAREIAGRIK